MARWLRALAALSEVLSSIPSTHMVFTTICNSSLASKLCRSALEVYKRLRNFQKYLLFITDLILCCQRMDFLSWMLIYLELVFWSRMRVYLPHTLDAARGDTRLLRHALQMPVITVFPFHSIFLDFFSRENDHEHKHGLQAIFPFK